MAHRLLPLVAAVLLLAIGQRSGGQEPAQPEPTNPSVNPASRPSDPVSVKEMSKQEIDDLFTKAFGKESAEIKLPIRIWIQDVGVAIAAEKATVSYDLLSVKLQNVGVAALKNLTDFDVLRGSDATIIVGNPISNWKQLAGRGFFEAQVNTENSVVTLLPEERRITKKMTEPVSIEVSGSPGKKSTIEVEKAVEVSARRVGFRFRFKIDPKAYLTDLLPTPPKASAKLPHWTNEDLAKVPELAFGEPISKDLPKHNAMEKTAHVMAKINHLNAKKRDGFMLAMLEQRPDLRGLPFLMADDCRTNEDQAKVFAMVANTIRILNGPAAMTADLSRPNGKSNIEVQRAAVAALMQINMSASEAIRVDLANELATIPHIDATKALAKLAIYSPEGEVRAAAIEALKTRRERDYTDVLLQGFRYPLPAVSKRAAEAMVKLERKDLLTNLVEVLESPDPRLPVTEKRDGKEVTLVRELVKVNHHRNCLLCHAPGNTENTPEGVLKVAVPLPSEPLPKPSEGGGYQSTPPATPDIVVRIDMTYLRQDFSMMMPVSDAHPWPEMQRFDFLVRTRVLTAAEAQAYEECCEAPELGQLSPYHRSALYALRELTGRDTEPTAAAWRKLLKLVK